MITFAFLFLLAAAIASYVMNRQAASQLRGGAARIHSLPSFHGLYAFLLVLIPTFV
ncbi:MAG: phosphate ABC transporter permease family protein, partial [Gemmobacter sp.]